MDDTLTQAKPASPSATDVHVSAQAAKARTIGAITGVLTALAEGVDPVTGEIFPAGCPYHSLTIVRALYGAIRMLENGSAMRSERAASRSREGMPANAGKPWTVEEDRQLLVEFDSGKSLKECAVLHQRTYAGIEARLEKLGRLDASDRTTSRRVPPRQAAAYANPPHHNPSPQKNLPRENPRREMA